MLGWGLVWGLVWYRRQPREIADLHAHGFGLQPADVLGPAGRQRGRRRVHLAVGSSVTPGLPKILSVPRSLSRRIVASRTVGTHAPAGTLATAATAATAGEFTLLDRLDVGGLDDLREPLGLGLDHGSELLGRGRDRAGVQRGAFYVRQASSARPARWPTAC